MSYAEAMMVSMEMGLIEQLEGMAARARDLFAGGQNARLRPNGEVHATTQVRWIAELIIPGARCHTGVSGGELGSIEPTRDEISCRSCIQILRSHGELPGPAGELQLALFDLAESDPGAPVDVL